jgi:hypothetical protein
MPTTAETPEWPTLEQIERQLCLPPGGAPREPAWLLQSYEDPRAFYLHLQQQQAPRLPVNSKSAPLKSYDFFHDAVVRNLSGGAPAFSWVDGAGTVNGLTYRELGLRAARRAACWSGAGAEPGQVICLLGSLGIELAVSLLAALKLGLVVSLLPPLGRRYLARRVNNLAPDWLDASAHYGPLMEPLGVKVIPREDNAAAAEEDLGRSHSYASGSVMGLLFDPAQEQSDQPRPLTSDEAYLFALRDGLVTLSLAEGLIYAAPGFHLLETQPSLLLGGWLCGASFLHLEPEVLARRPELLVERELHAVGINTEVRDLLTRAGASVGQRWRYWFRNPAESRDLEAWIRFIEEAGLRGTFCGNLRWQAAVGGCTLTSARRTGMVSCGVWPGAGAPWLLGSVIDPATPAVGASGVLALQPLADAEGDPTSSGSILARGQGEYIFAGMRGTSRMGRTYPAVEVIEALRGLQGVLAATICQPPPTGEIDGAVALLVFCGAGDHDAAGIQRAITARIEAELGRELLPDRIELFGLHPRRGEDGGVDHAWCQAQYLMGQLRRQAADELCCITSAIRERVAPYLEPEA